MRTCEDGCNGCDECTDYADYADEDDGPPEYGCCLPEGECCMPGLHFPSECHTAADYERTHGVDWRAGGTATLGHNVPVKRGTRPAG